MVAEPAAMQNSPLFPRSSGAVTIATARCVYPQRDGQAELAWMAGYIAIWFTCPKSVTITLLSELNGEELVPYISVFTGRSALSEKQ